MYQLTQHKFWGVLALIISIMFVAFMVTGCGGNDDDDDDDDTGTDGGTEPEAPSATTVTATPAGGVIPSTQSFQLVFDQGIDSATLAGAAATGSGKNWSASPTLTQGDGQMLAVTWKNRDGSDGSAQIGPYNVSDPDTDPPEITGGTVADGAADVDPAPINQGGIKIDFNEPLAKGSIELQDEAGANLNWTGKIEGSSAILTPVAGQEIANETTYKVVLSVEDGSANKTDATITFVTKPKE